MRSLPIVMGVVLFIVNCVAQTTPIQASPQSSTPSQFVFRLQQMRSEYLNIPRIQHDCVLVLADGRYHREHRQDRANDEHALQKPWLVYEGRLSAQELSSLGAMVNSEAFKELSSQPLARNQRVPIRGTILTVLVVRDDGAEPQSVRLLSKEEIERYQKAITPILDWLKQMQKRKGDKAKDSNYDLCRLPPQVTVGTRVYESPKQEATPQ